MPTKGFLPYTDRLWREAPERYEPVEPELGRTVAALAGKATVDVVTARGGCEEQMRGWLEAEGVDAYDGFAVDTDKHELRYDGYLEDNPAVAAEVQEAGGHVVRVGSLDAAADYLARDPVTEETVLLYDQPWNQDVTADATA